MTEREEFTGAAGGKESGHLIAAQPVEIGAVAGLVERVVGPEGRDGERQQAIADPAGHLLGGHPAHALILQRLTLKD